MGSGRGDLGLVPHTCRGLFWLWRGARAPLSTAVQGTLAEASSPAEQFRPDGPPAMGACYACDRFVRAAPRPPATPQPPGQKKPKVEATSVRPRVRPDCSGFIFAGRLFCRRSLPAIDELASLAAAEG
jgi:hypothetical protein